MYVSKQIWRKGMPDVSRRSANSSSWLWYVYCIIGQVSHCYRGHIKTRQLKPI